MDTNTTTTTTTTTTTIGPVVIYRDVHGVIWQGTLVSRTEHGFLVERNNGPATLHDTIRATDIRTQCDNPHEHAGFACDHPVTHEHTIVTTADPANLSDTVEVTLHNGETARGIVTSRDQSSTGEVIGYRIWLPGRNRYTYEHASRTKVLRDTRPAGQRRRPTRNELNEH